MLGRSSVAFALCLVACAAGCTDNPPPAVPAESADARAQRLAAERERERKQESIARLDDRLVTLIRERDKWVAATPVPEHIAPMHRDPGPLTPEQIAEIVRKQALIAELRRFNDEIAAARNALEASRKSAR